MTSARRPMLRSRVAWSVSTAAVAVLAVVSASAPAATAASGQPKSSSSAAKVSRWQATPGAPTTRSLTFGDYRFSVPSDWPVYDLTADPTQCVRTDVHAVYLGHPGNDQQCPPRIVGTTESLLVEPNDAASQSRLRAGALSVPTGTAVPGELFAAGGGRAQVVVPDAGVIVTATYLDDRATIAAALDSGAAIGSAPTGGPATPTPAAPSPAASASPTTASNAPSAANAATVTVATGHGAGFAFDSCGTPDLSTMRAWLKSPYRTAGVYFGGVAAGCPGSFITPSWVASVTGMGWGIVPIYVGHQAPLSNCGGTGSAPRFNNCAGMSIYTSTAASMGAADAADTISSARTAGLAPGNTLYFDMESYPNAGSTNCAAHPTYTGCVNTASVMAYLSAWTKALHTAGYRSGVYSSSSTGMADLVAYQGKTGFSAPDNLWMASWNSNVTAYGDNWVPDSVYRGQRMHQYEGGHIETWGGASFDIDSNAIDGEQDCAPPGCTSAITQLWTSLGGARSALHNPIGSEGATAVGGGRTRSYQTGAIVLGATIGVHEIHGAIYDRYRIDGGTRSVLGFPTSDTYTARDGFSRVSNFVGGMIVYTATTGAHEMHGSILSLWRSMGATKSALRDPTSDQTAIAGGLGQMNSFRLGAIYWSPTLGVHEVHGALFAAYRSQGGPTGALGLPTSNTFTWGTLRRSNFQHGFISYSPAIGSTRVTFS